MTRPVAEMMVGAARVETLTAADDHAANAGGRPVTPAISALDLPKLAAHHFGEALTCLRNMKRERAYIERFCRDHLDDLQAQAEEIGPDNLYFAFSELEKWCDQMLDAIEYRKQNLED